MKIILILGGARSGKSRFALEQGSHGEGAKAFIATAQALDDEMRVRIEKHKQERSSAWKTLEEPLRIPALLGEIQSSYQTLLLDCLTLWVSNLLGMAPEGGSQVHTVESRIQEFLSMLHNFRQNDSSSALYIIANEVGLGIVPDNELARRFRDLAGGLNQGVAEIAQEVYFMAAGIPVKIK